MASMTEVDKKLNLVLQKLDRLEELLTVEEDLPLKDEAASIKAYMVRKTKGKNELHKLEDVIDAI